MSRVHGNGALILEHSGKIVSDRYGLWTGRLRYSLLETRQDLMPQVGDVHPKASWMFCEKREIIFSPKRWLIDCDFVGSDVIDTVPVYELNRGTNTDPIETNTRFVSHIGGKPSAPLNGALFVDDDGNPTADNTRGMFHRFRMTLEDGVRNPLAGVTSFLNASNTTWTKSWTTRTKPTDGGAVGKIDTPEGGAPSYTDHNWLYVGLSFTERQNVYQVRKTWMLSGLGGWNSTIYGA